MNDNKILEGLERLAAAFPWDRVEITMRRKPSGEVSFSAYVPPDYDRCINGSVCGLGDTLAEALSEAIAEAPSRDPEAAREKAIREMREKIAKLEALDLRYPPYRPGTLLAAGALAADIEAETLTV